MYRTTVTAIKANQRLWQPSSLCDRKNIIHFALGMWGCRGGCHYIFIHIKFERNLLSLEVLGSKKGQGQSEDVVAILVAPLPNGQYMLPNHTHLMAIKYIMFINYTDGLRY